MMKNIRYSRVGILFAVIFLSAAAWLPVRAALTGSSNDTPEKRQYLVACQGAVEADVNAQLKAKTIDITQALGLKNQGRNKCADEARAMPGPEEKKDEPVVRREGRNYVYVVDARPEEMDGIRCINDPANNLLEVLKHPASVSSDKSLGIQEDDGSVTLLPGNAGYDLSGGQKIIIPGLDQDPEGGQEWEVQVKVTGTALMKFDYDTVFILPCRDENKQTHAQRIILEEGYLSFIKKLVNHQIQFEVQTKDAVAGVKGTTFTVSRREGEDTTISVSEGVVAVTPTNIALKPFDLIAGQAATVSAETVSPIQSTQTDGTESSGSVLYYALAGLAVIAGGYYGLRRARK